MHMRFHRFQIIKELIHTQMHSEYECIKILKKDKNHQ